MEIGMIGVGAMGGAMAGHIAARGEHRVLAHDVDRARLAAVATGGIEAADSLAALAGRVEVAIVMVSTDDQVRDVCGELRGSGRPGLRVVVASTNRPELMRELDGPTRAAGQHLVDAPVVFGLKGAREGTLVSLCGGRPEDVDAVRPVLACYSTRVFRMGGIGQGQLTKTVNNMLHWSACVANYEAILLGKAHGLDGQRLREVLLECPARNGTLQDWDDSRFTWHEKDMDIALEMAQEAGMMLPLFGLVDQLVKHLEPDRVARLLYRERTDYLGREVAAPKAESSRTG